LYTKAEQSIFFLISTQRKGSKC